MLLRASMRAATVALALRVLVLVSVHSAVFCRSDAESNVHVAEQIKFDRANAAASEDVEGMNRCENIVSKLELDVESIMSKPVMSFIAEQGREVIAETHALSEVGSNMGITLAQEHDFGHWTQLRSKLEVRATHVAAAAPDTRDTMHMEASSRIVVCACLFVDGALHGASSGRFEPHGLDTNVDVASNDGITIASKMELLSRVIPLGVHTLTTVAIVDNNVVTWDVLVEVPIGVEPRRRRMPRLRLFSEPNAHLPATKEMPSRWACADVPGHSMAGVCRHQNSFCLAPGGGSHTNAGVIVSDHETPGTPSSDYSSIGRRGHHHFGFPIERTGGHKPQPRWPGSIKDRYGFQGSTEGGLPFNSWVSGVFQSSKWLEEQKDNIQWIEGRSALFVGLDDHMSTKFAWNETCGKTGSMAQPETCHVHTNIGHFGMFANSMFSYAEFFEPDDPDRPFECGPFDTMHILRRASHWGNDFTRNMEPILLGSERCTKYRYFFDEPANEHPICFRDVVITGRTGTQMWGPEDAEALRERIGWMTGIPFHPLERIPHAVTYIKRSNTNINTESNRARRVNDDEVVEAIRQHIEPKGYSLKVAYLEDLSWLQQLTLFASSKILIGQTSAGIIGNAVFMCGGCAIIEFQSILSIHNEPRLAINAAGVQHFTYRVRKDEVVQVSDKGVIKKFDDTMVKSFLDREVYRQWSNRACTDDVWCNWMSLMYTSYRVDIPRFLDTLNEAISSVEYFYGSFHPGEWAINETPAIASAYWNSPLFPDETRNN